MEKYTVKYLTGPIHSATAVYHADTLSTAMRMHNSAMPEYADKVISWECNRMTFQFHDSKMTL